MLLSRWMDGLPLEKGGVTLGGIWSFPPALPALPAPPAHLGEMSRSDPSLAGSEFDFELVRTRTWAAVASLLVCALGLNWCSVSSAVRSSPQLSLQLSISPLLHLYDGLSLFTIQTASSLILSRKPVPLQTSTARGSTFSSALDTLHRPSETTLV